MFLLNEQLKIEPLQGNRRRHLSLVSQVPQSSSSAKQRHHTLWSSCRLDLQLPGAHLASRRRNPLPPAHHTDHGGQVGEHTIWATSGADRNGGARPVEARRRCAIQDRGRKTLQGMGGKTREKMSCHEKLLRDGSWLVCDLFSYSLLEGLFSLGPKLNKSVAKLNYRGQKYYSLSEML
jgi:hypothetical protein